MVRTYHQERTLFPRHQLTEDTRVLLPQSAPFLNLTDSSHSSLRDSSQQKPKALHNLESQAGRDVAQSKVFFQDARGLGSQHWHIRVKDETWVYVTV